ncbi:CusA/CzcA family heavy metal efflux RND transporter [Stutzerimonas stutzeri]|uniref:CusA/CzcA family heavy metal efflux RND transporter n=1 Tax=Stutzerimonas stutzeri TaxID=316 RepID=UPI00300F2E52
MIAALIRWSVLNRFLVLLTTLLMSAVGIWAVRTTPIDALPDLSDVQVIIRTAYPGQAPQIVENQVTYPLTTTMLSVPGAKTVRGYSFFGDSFVYVLFEDGTDLYWARSRVLEYLSQVQSRLPAAAKPSLGPDATGVGWIYQYALIDRSGAHDLAQLRSLQDWFLKYELITLPNVAEVATIGGMVKQYQIVLDPLKMASLAVTQAQVIEAIGKANQETGGAVLELAETEYMVRASGYLQTLDDFRQIPLQLSARGVPVTLGDVAHIQLGPEMRRGIAELDGEGETVGGVVILRSGKNARETLAAVHAKLKELKSSLPEGVEIVTTYDRSELIDRAVENLSFKLLEEFVVVALVCGVFLWHLRSSLVAIVSLPIGILIAFVVMRYQGINANIMSLGGIAIAIGAMVDAAVVMIENAHKKAEAWRHANPGKSLEGEEHWRVMTSAAQEVGPALFFCLLIITLSFIPVFTLEAQEGRLFGPLAFTKTYAMAAAAGLSVTLVPVLMGYWIRGKLPDEARNPLNRGLIRVYRPALNAVLDHPKTTIAVAVLILATTLWPISRLGGEFLPPMDEGDLLYMPSALPGLSAQKAAQLLQQTDRMIRTVPEVETVFGKAGRAESATDPAPLEMFETTIRFKPREQWRAGMTPEKLIDELDWAVQVPGLTNIWIPPIRNRIDMLATGIKSPIGVKIAGANLEEIDRVSQQVEAVARKVPGVSSALAERLVGGRYVDIDIDRRDAARYGLNIADVQSIVSSAIGGETVGETIEGLARYPISVRYLIDAISELRGVELTITHRVRATRARWQQLALTNAEQALGARLANRQHLSARFDALAEALELDEPPMRLECFDISHSSGEATVASCVVFGPEGPLKSDYRRYNIEGVTAGDDYAAMHQALSRRFRKAAEGEGKLPDILLVDGGKGQLNMAREVLEELAVPELILLGVAKGVTRKPGLETLYLNDAAHEFTLAADSPALHLIQQVRDEAHRFAITGHRARRGKARRTSTLEDVPGIGPKRRRELLTHFGGLQELCRASLDEIAKAPGISKKLAESIYAALHSE